MRINFQLQALELANFHTLLTMQEDELPAYHARWIDVDAEPGYPCRVSLQDARIGERVLGLSYVHHDVNSPYRAAGPIFIREHAKTARPAVNEIPSMFTHRLLSIRGYNVDHDMRAAEVVEGKVLSGTIEKQFQNDEIDYIHIHNANPGCFNCAVYRV